MTVKRFRRARAFAIDDCGAAAVEFAMVSSAFITMIFGITYLSIMLHHRATLQWAVESAIRTAAITTTVTQSTMQTKVNAYLTSAGMPNATTTYTVVAGAIPVATLTSTFSQTYKIPFVSTFNINYTATAKTPQGS
jgi:Flp pilus assembly protein TadG